MEDEKGLVAREWLYTKVSGVWYLVFGVGGSIQRYLVLILLIIALSIYIVEARFLLMT